MQPINKNDVFMKIINGYMPFAAALAAVALGVAACGNDDSPSGPGIDYGDKYVTGYRMEYSVKLADPNVHEVADVLVTYIDADGSELEDTLYGQEWAKTVVMPKGNSQTYGLAARFASKEAPVLTHDTYDFAVDLTSRIFTLYSTGSQMLLASPTNHVSKGILLPDNDGETRSVRSASYLVTPQAREDMDTTTTYFNFTSMKLESGRDTLIYNDFNFQ